MRETPRSRSARAECGSVVAAERNPPEGMSEARVQTAMRHANPNMTRSYAKQRDRGEAAELMADILLKSA